MISTRGMMQQSLILTDASIFVGMVIRIRRIVHNVNVFYVQTNIT